MQAGAIPQIVQNQMMKNLSMDFRTKIGMLQQHGNFN